MQNTKLHDSSEPQLGAFLEATKRDESVQFSDMKSAHGDVQPQPPVPDDQCPRCGGALERGQALFSLSQMVRAAWESEAKPTLQDCLKCPSCGYSETLKSKL